MKSQKSAEAGFTLLELLVSMTVLVALSLVLLNITSHVANLWGRAESQNQLRQNSRIIMEFLRRDLQQLVFPLESHDTSVYIVQNPPGLAADFLHHDALFWRAAIGSTEDGGDLSGVAYFLRKEGTTYTLCRALIPASQWTGTAPLPDEEEGEGAVYIQQPETWVRAAPADKASSYRGLFLKDVLGFWVTAYGEDGLPYLPDSRSDGKRPSRFDIALVFMDKAGMIQVDAVGMTLPDAAGYSNVDSYLANLQEGIRAHIGVVKVNIPLEPL